MFNDASLPPLLAVALIPYGGSHIKQSKNSLNLIECYLAFKARISGNCNLYCRKLAKIFNFLRFLLSLKKALYLLCLPTPHPCKILISKSLP